MSDRLPDALESSLRSYAGPAVAFPHGGIGTGTVSLAADGSFTQWEIHNRINHAAQVPGAGFAIRASCIEPPSDVRRWLRARPTASAVPPAPNVTDHQPAPWPSLTDGWPAVESARFSAAYPFTRVAFEDPDLPVDVRLDASTPFVPLDVEASSLPIIVTTWRIANRTAWRQHGWLLATLLNTVGWDGVTPIDGTRSGVLGGATIEQRLGDRDLRLILEGPADVAPPRQPGSQVLWTDAPAVALPQAADVADVLRWVDTLGLVEPTQTGAWDDATMRRATARLRPMVGGPVGPSPQGQTWLGGLAAAFSVAPGDVATITIAQAWWFPDRRIDFDQFGPAIPPPDDDRLGNAYTDPFTSASDVVDAWLARRSELDRASFDWATAWSGTSLPDPVLELLQAQPCGVRSPVVFVAADGNAFGFEGGLGESTRNWHGDVGGSCPLNCTHVWNYEQALAGLYPSLERTMRMIEWDHLQAADGSIPHRVRVPLDGAQLHGVPIGGPLDPALDGMLGAVLKTYRDARITGDRNLLRHAWPGMQRLIQHVRERWASDDGLLRGRQPVTFDIDLTGPNAYVGGMWIAALKAMTASAEALGDVTSGRSYRDLAAASSTAYDELLWNGEYYGQAASGAAFDFGDGCLTDQLLGQWWAHVLDLGHVFPADHVRTTLRSIVRYNLRHGFREHHHGERVFADGDDTGVLVCTWPHGGRPPVPLRYADEVWSGSEYQLAAHCAFEGLTDESLLIVKAARGRQDGSRRNPFNEIECGDHYVRALSGWSHLQAWTGFVADGLRGVVRVGASGRYPFVTGEGWGIVEAGPNQVRIEVRWGRVRAREFELDGRRIPAANAPGDDGWVEARAGSSIVLAVATD